MLPTQQFAARLARMGFDAAYHGSAATSRPQHEPAATHWLTGWQRGHEQRRIDLREGSHPDLNGRSEFGEQRGSRRGVCAGSKGK